MGKALYRSYRPTSLADAVGQEHITTTLKNALESDDISHAYLLTGPRGTGKTSIARILAHEINKLPYDGDDSTHLDIIEIDAASNRRIDDIRDLRDKVHIAPTSAKYKVYIIDEVHMLTNESFNALLKTLEEPPAHVVFILATTEAHKLPETIMSRTQRFTFRPVELSKVVAHLRSIAKSEKIVIDDDALELVAEHGEGSFRDSINLLDQARGQAAHITAAHIQELLGVPPKEALDALILAIASHDSGTLITLLGNLQLQGQDAARVSKQLARLLRQQLINSSLTIEPTVLTSLLSKLLDVASSPQPFRYLELVLLEACFSGIEVTVLAAAAPKHAIKVTQPLATKTSAAKVHKSNLEPVAKKLPHPELTTIIDIVKEPTKTKPSPVPAEDAPNKLEPAPAKTTATGSVDPAIWNSVLNEVKKQYNTLYGIARMASVTAIEDGLRLGFKFAFHQKRVNEAKNKTIIIDIIEKLTGVTIILECVLDEAVESAPAQNNLAGEPLPLPPADVSMDELAPEVPSQKPTFNALQDISNIFGSAEVLES